MAHDHWLRTHTPASYRRLTLSLAVAAQALLAGGVQADPQVSAGGIHIPTVTNFCGGDAVIVSATICNDQDVARTYNVELVDGGTPPAYPCTESLVPEHVFLDPLPFVVGANECRTLHIRITRPDALDSNASVCWWALFTPDTGGVVLLGAQLIDSFVSCINWAIEEQVVFMNPLDPVVLDPSITNLTADPIVFDYLIEVRNAEGSTEQGTIVLNDGGIAEPVVGSVDIGPGETVQVELSASWRDPGAMGIFDVVVLGDVPGPGLARRDVGEIASIGLARTSAVVAVGEPGSASGAGARLRVAPNPWRGSGAVAFGFDVPQVWREAIVYDAAGRRVRVLGGSGGIAHSQLTWDGRDDAGHVTPPGVYFATVTTPAGPRGAKVVRLP